LLIVASVLSWTLDLHFRGPLRLDSWAVVDGVMAGGLGLVVNAHGRLKAERDAAEARAEAAALTAQIRPHFLFNTLNAISAQVKHDPDAAQENLGRLADMFRYTMHHARQDLVPIADEIALAREYLLLEKARFGERLSFELPEPVAELEVPGLTLQPLVENAVRHGIAKTISGGCIHVSLERLPHRWALRVRNPISANRTIPEEYLFREGHALWILKRRLPSLKVNQQPGLFEVVVPL
jgi:LytS/YehU family sensor histidine kinase